MATESGLKWEFRGPNPFNPNTDQFWNGPPFNYEKGVWGFWDRSQLPKEYTQLTDWWSDATLALEAELSKRFHIPWALRGPPNGPEGGRLTWRGMHWRPQARKWMNRKGNPEKMAYRKRKYGIMNRNGNHNALQDTVMDEPLGI